MIIGFPKGFPEVTKLRTLASGNPRTLTTPYHLGPQGLKAQDLMDRYSSLIADSALDLGSFF